MKLLFFLALSAVVFAAEPQATREPDFKKAQDEAIQSLQGLIRVDASNPPGNESGIGESYLESLDGREQRRLMATDVAGVWAASGWLLFVRQGTLAARSFDEDTGQFTGEPVPVADPVGFDPGFNIGGFSVSAKGLLAYRAGGAEPRQLTWFDRSGKPLGTLGESTDTNINYP